MFYKNIFWLLLGIILLTTSAAAEVDLTKIKQDVEGLIVENQKLIAQNQTLQGTLGELQAQIEQVSADIKTLEANKASMTEALRQAQNEIVVKESRQVFLKAQLLDLEEKTQQKNLESIELQSKK